MSQVKGRDTSIEKEVRSRLHRMGLRFRKHVKGLPGKPDVVFPRAKLAVFIEGDFWHGWRFPAWAESLSPRWRQKIRGTRDRDRRNFAKLRRGGWAVIRVWQHEIEADPARATDRIADAVKRLERVGQLA